MVKVKIPSTAITGNKTSILTSPLNKLWRAKILLNRKTSGMPQNAGDQTKMPKSSPVTNKSFQEDAKEFAFLKEAQRHQTEDTKLVTPYNRTVNNQIIIINTHTQPYTKVEIQGKPSEVEVVPDSNWATVKSIGRNNPFMIYTGGEDTITIDVSWFSTQKDRKDVINKCKLLESWSRSDGYTASPPVLHISWGSSNLFKGQTFVLTSAKYSLSNFQNSYNPSGSRRNLSEIIDLGLLPNCAVQKLIFKKTTGSNTTHEEIISRNELKNTQGVIL